MKLGDIIPCVICGTLFATKSSRHCTCGPVCAKERKRMWDAKRHGPDDERFARYEITEVKRTEPRRDCPSYGDCLTAAALAGKRDIACGSCDKGEQSGE